jgi:hypothetical protein
MKHKALKDFGAVFVMASIATLLAAFVLWRDGHPFLAADVLILSPFPCPGPLPC